MIFTRINSDPLKKSGVALKHFMASAVSKLSAPNTYTTSFLESKYHWYYPDNGFQKMCPFVLYLITEECHMLVSSTQCSRVFPHQRVGVGLIAHNLNLNFPKVTVLVSEPETYRKYTLDNHAKKDL